MTYQRDFALIWSKLQRFLRLAAGLLAFVSVSMVTAATRAQQSNVCTPYVSEEYVEIMATTGSTHCCDDLAACLAAAGCPDTRSDVGRPLRTACAVCTGAFTNCTSAVIFPVDNHAPDLICDDPHRSMCDVAPYCGALDWCGGVCTENNACGLLRRRPEFQPVVL